VRKLATAEGLAGIFALAFILGGVLGFVPGVVQDYRELRWWKSGSGAELFGLFQTSILHNLLSIGVGVVGLVAARRPASARAFLTGGGILLFAIGIYGLLIDYGSDWNFIPVDRADDWLNIGLGLAMLHAGVALRLAPTRPSVAAAP
jgi:Domain of unknown function (DUF4383)